MRIRFNFQSLNKVLRIVFSTLLLLYTSAILLLHIPLVQRKIGDIAANALSQKIGSNVTIGRLDVGLLNRIIMDDVAVNDQSGLPLLSISRLAATVEILPVFAGQFNIKTAQIIGLTAHLVKPSPESVTNFQFIIDSFTSKDDDKETTPPNLKMKSFIMRNANIFWDVSSAPRKDSSAIDLNHLALQDVGITLSVHYLTEDSLAIDLKRLNFKEKHSGLELTDMEMLLATNKQALRLDTLHMKTPASEVNMSNVQVHFTTNEKGEYQFQKVLGSIQNSFLSTSDLAHVAASVSEFDLLKRIDDSFKVEANFEADEDLLKIDQLHLDNANGGMRLAADMDVKQWQGHPQLGITLHHFDCQPSALNWLDGLLNVDEGTKAWISRMGNISLQGHASQTDGMDWEGNLHVNTNVGDIDLEGGWLHAEKQISVTAETEGFQLGQFLENGQIGTTSLSLHFATTLEEKSQTGGTTVSQAAVCGDIFSLEYAGYEYSNIHLDGNAGNGWYEGLLKVDDENVNLELDGKIDMTNKVVLTDLLLHVRQFNPYALHLTDKFKNEQFSFRALANTSGNSFRSATGLIQLDSVAITTPSDIIRLQQLSCMAERDGDQQHVEISGDFIDATFDGNTSLLDIASAVQHELSHHFPALIAPNTKEFKQQMVFNVEMSESPFLHHFIDEDYELTRPVRLTGYINSEQETAHVAIDAPSVNYQGKRYDNIAVNYESQADSLQLNATLLQRNENSSTRLHLNASGHADKLLSQLSWKIADNSIANHSSSENKVIPAEGTINASTMFSRTDHNLKTNIQLLPSDISINDTIWHLAASEIEVQGKRIACNNLKISNNNRFLKAEGVLSSSPTDSLQVTLNDIQVEYVLDLVDFTAVDFRGRASGYAYIGNVFDKVRLASNLRVEDFSIGVGNLGTGFIHANWDDSVDGVRVDGHIVDTDAQGKNRITDCRGYISPSHNDIQLRIDANNTNAYFLNSFLAGIFSDIEGCANGVMNVTGPLNNIGLVGDMSADVAMRLRATNVRYHVSPADTLHFVPYRFRFDDIHISDDLGNQGVVNGFVSHKNVKNFSYQFRVDMQQLMAYEEKAFNSDKFMGTVFADGWLTVNGADRHPLYINADVTPTRGSYFAYDAATPDAIASSSFITFHDRGEQAEQQYASDTTSINSSYEYSGDIFMEIGIHLNPTCEIKLRMDNADDGYISTFGNGTLQALYHNKGTFTLNGTYNINNGSYRLYLQDIIYRDLAIQPGSSVVFNGNPFDANIHLICWHTINSVPLADLTSNSAYNSNSKVKVICLLDITGQLGNMNFKFDINLPNVNDETRQIVRSLISTDEEMNMQMIYLLGLGRFYTNEYARAAGESGSSQAVNTLLSSTISGQINQMLTNAIGSESKWNFGTGLSTGERGWNDLDIEGILSGKLLDDRLLINGNFGYRDNTLTQSSNFIGDFDVKWRIRPNGNTYLKAYNQTNDRYFTKATINTQGIGISYQRDFQAWKELFKKTINKQRHE